MIVFLTWLDYSNLNSIMGLTFQLYMVDTVVMVYKQRLEMQA
jgi:hypothetical protein